MSKTFLYYAYGSNLLPRRLLERTPSARVVDIASLEGYALRWHQRSHDGSGKCDVIQVEDAESRVWGVVYEVPLAEKHVLDAAEALGVEYAERSATVDGRQARHRVIFYQGLIADNDARPYPWYRSLVLAGAREHAFPADYLDAMARVDTIPDADLARGERFERLARGE